MKVTTKGQVTIPQRIRLKYGITVNSEVDFVDDEGKVYLVKKKAPGSTRFKKIRGTAAVTMTTDEILALTRKS